MSSLPAVDSNQLLLFTLGEPRYALALAVVERVIQAVEIMPLPKAPPLVLGLINVRGHIIPVVDIRECFGMPAREITVNDKFILARTLHRRVAVVADAVSGVVIPTERQWAAAGDVLPGAEFITAVAKLDEILVLVCDLEQILSLETERVLTATLPKLMPAEAILTQPLREAELAWLSGFVADHLGLRFARAQWPDLERQASLAAAEFGHADARGFLQWLHAEPLSQTHIERLAAHLTIPESYFWRDPRALEALRDTILPELIQARRSGSRVLRLWCAGCSTGEEAYSLACVVRDLIPAGPVWDITVLATDINPQRLSHAALGVYDEWSFRGTPSYFKEKYFHPRANGQYEVIPEIRQMVTFAYLNLAEAVYPSVVTNTLAMDIIFCRNVLIYFVKDRSREVAARFHAALNDGGWLAVAATELSEKVFPQFTAIRFPGAFLYRREASAPVTAPLPAVTAPLSPVTASLPPATAPLPAVTAPIPAARAPIPPPSPVPTAPLMPPSPSQAVRALANQGRRREALAACEKALDTYKLDPGLHYLHAVILIEENREVGARVALQRVLYLDPDFVLAHFSLGQIWRRQGNRGAAEKSFRNTLTLLSGFKPEDILPEAEGLTAGRLVEIVQASLETGPLSL